MFVGTMPTHCPFTFISIHFKPLHAVFRFISEHPKFRSSWFISEIADFRYWYHLGIFNKISVYNSRLMKISHRIWRHMIWLIEWRILKLKQKYLTKWVWKTIVMLETIKICEIHIDDIRIIVQRMEQNDDRIIQNHDRSTQGSKNLASESLRLA